MIPSVCINPKSEISLSPDAMSWDVSTIFQSIMVVPSKLNELGIIWSALLLHVAAVSQSPFAAEMYGNGVVCASTKDLSLSKYLSFKKYRSSVKPSIVEP